MTTPEQVPVPGGEKDWTWVLERPCAECGVVAGDIALRDVPGLVAASTQAWRLVLEADDVERRPRPDVWSPLEYACHVRDVHRVFDERLRLMLACAPGEAARFANWDQDATAVAERYAEQEPEAVHTDLTAAAHVVAGRYAALAPDDAERVGLRSNGSAFTVRTFAQYHLHDVLHHLHDVGVAVDTQGVRAHPSDTRSDEQ